MKTRHELRSSHLPAEHRAPPAAPSAASLPALRRRTFLGGLLAGASAYALGCAGRKGAGAGAGATAGVSLPESQAGEDIFAFLTRTRGGFDATLYRQILGAANEYKEGDEALGVAARDAGSRQRARALLRETRVRDLMAHPVFEDQV
ncbi:MAG TPA: ethanolamine ammonia-lyase subunit EutB, partial [Haliangium sp.]|nr:ethanolamine ammonia-lyase subunit EutB [Haliangium sp.]